MFISGWSYKIEFIKLFFQAALEIVKKKFPIEAELLLIDEDSGYALKKTKWEEAVIKTKVTSEEIETSMGKNK